MVRITLFYVTLAHFFWEWAKVATEWRYYDRNSFLPMNAFCIHVCQYWYHYVCTKEFTREC